MIFPSIYWTTPPMRQQCDGDRRGAVLLIVLVILTIFATMGLAFMFYAESAASSSLAFKDSVVSSGPDINPELAGAMFLEQFIFDCKDDASGYWSALRGHSLVRNMYELKYTLANGVATLDVNNNVPFNGTGRLHWIYGKSGLPGGPLSNGDDFNYINYGYSPLDGFVRDPGLFGVRSVTAARNQANQPFLASANPPYTAADMNARFLAAVKADGTVLMPSYFRGTLNGFGSLDPNPNANSKWLSTTTALTDKYLSLRPLPGDHMGFPPPEDPGGDVRNRPPTWSSTFNPSANNDSIWIYTGAPIFTRADGTRYTFLCAPLIVDLDGKLNINALGNMRGKNNTHASNQGWGGPTEVSLFQLLTAIDPVTKKPEWTNVFNGATANNIQRLTGRYGASKLPGGATPATSPLLTNPGFYAKIDYDAVTGWTLQVGGNPTGTWTLPGPFQSWPTYPAGYENASAAELNQQPLLYVPLATTGDRRVFPASELNKLYRVGDTNADAMLGDLWQLLPTNFNTPNDVAGSLKRRNLITTLSADRREVGMLPWLYNPTTPSSYQIQGFNAGGSVALTPAGLPLASPPLTLFNSAATRNIGKEYGAADWRGVVPTLPTANVRLDLNRPLTSRPLTAYPTPDPASGQFKPTDMAQALKAQADRQQFALYIYQILVKVTGAFDPFAYSKKAGTPAAPALGDKNALRYLAQLATNIVDYIDIDDCITPFNWGVQGSKDFQTDWSSTWGTEWVYGTELPKVVINEAYCEYKNDPTDPGMTQQLQNQKPPAQHATRYLVDIWAELCNPFKTDTNLVGGGDARLQTQALGSSAGYPVYRLAVVDTMVSKGANVSNLQYIHAPTNIDGRPDDQMPQLPGPNTVINPNEAPTGSMSLTATTVRGYVNDWTTGNGAGVDPKVLKALNGAFAAPTNQGTNIGFYLVGPRDPTTKSIVAFPTATSTGTTLPVPQATLSATGMRHTFTLPTPPTSTSQTGPPPSPTLLLQRLLCPNMPHNPSATIPPLPPNTPFNPQTYQPNPNYNPYITVDYFQNILIKGNDATTENGLTPPNGGSHNASPVNSRIAVGRPEPYKGQASQNQLGFASNQPKHTFFANNVSSGNVPNVLTWPQVKAPAGYPAFSWLVHLDRNLISPMELLHVSGFRAHELTQQFNGQMRQQTPTGQASGGHQAPWFDNNSRLYRFLEFVQTTPRQAGIVNATTGVIGPRIPGKVNINTVWDPIVFQAICDPQLGSHFTANDVTAIATQLLAQRNPTGGVPGPNDHPFLPLSAGYVPNADPQYPTGLGICDTILRPFQTTAQRNQDPNQPNALRQFEPQANTAATNPYQRFELLTKIYNNFTTRSNCFAVWVTVGMFEVKDPATTDPKYKKGPIMGSYLGQEINRAAGTNIRHRIFAVVDRSVMDGVTPSPGGGPTFLPLVGGTAQTQPRCVAEQVLNQSIQFNPHAAMFKDLVPFFTVIE